ncbi:hypothetical protein AX14_000843 [Amanita brunnescens Koide BX004]|nr:hypothetical protein AX14_000843 [Amanita brunnescens Koide BX004]
MCGTSREDSGDEALFNRSCAAVFGTWEWASFSVWFAPYSFILQWMKNHGTFWRDRHQSSWWHWICCIWRQL